MTSMSIFEQLDRKLELTFLVASNRPDPFKYLTQENESTGSYKFIIEHHVSSTHSIDCTFRFGISNEKTLTMKINYDRLDFYFDLNMYAQPLIKIQQMSKLTSLSLFYGIVMTQFGKYLRTKPKKNPDEQTDPEHALTIFKWLSDVPNLN